MQPNLRNPFLFAKNRNSTMKIISIATTLALATLAGATIASADPWKDESGNGRWRGGYERDDGYPGRGYGYGREHRFDRDEFPGRGYGYYGGRREQRAYKEEYYDGRCKVERKWERNGGYKEERKCREGYPAYGYRY
jgi:hypothetical protein